ncbi:MAG: HigA family addiction module antidote protein [Bacteroidetes bacterium]|nr:HigA family addiction module antidote protein [Bacteroidota bacterium]MBU2586307.1 HigA family addiction module antidote protein [Bacteroidota bacterium]
MSKDYQIKKELLSPPGDTLQETIDKIGMNQYELAERLGKNIKNVNQIIKGKEPITTDTAIALEKVLGVPADFWLERERQYRREQTEIIFDEYLEECKEWIKAFPTTVMTKLGWIPKVDDTIELIKVVLSYFGIASPEQWEKIYIKDEESVAFRMSLAHVNEPQSISAWLRKGEIDARELKLKEYSKDNFKNALIDIKNISYKHPKNFKEQLQKICAESGVALIYTPNLPKATISGAARWIFNTTVPLIQLSGRYKTNDHFWFTFFHEAGHILLHGKKDIFLEDVEGSEMNKQKEEEADLFARKWLIGNDDYDELTTNYLITEELILKYSRKTKTHPGIIVGRLQHDGLLPHSRLNHLKEHIELI